jgi:2-polyprenyl-3-methyl-5-hydroxy-6-metoxy-1,4-benzoquinol methylase
VADGPSTTHQETVNLEKYERGGVNGFFLGRFRAQLAGLVTPLRPGRVLDVGCGEGVVTGWLAETLPAAAVEGVDAGRAALAEFRRRNPALTVREGDVYDLPHADASFDLVVSTEMLEHLERPQQALREMARVSGGWMVLTVPHEPFFRAGNLALGRYARRLGSTPGHLNTWSGRSFRALVDREASVIRWVSAFPWQAVLARPRRVAR